MATTFVYSEACCVFKSVGDSGRYASILLHGSISYCEAAVICRLGRLVGVLIAFPGISATVPEAGETGEAGGAGPPK